MHDPLLRSFSGSDSDSQTRSKDSWLNRVRENLGQLLIPSHLKPSSANGAPIHLLKFDKSPRPARAQGVSLVTHAIVFATIVFLLTNTKVIYKDPLHNGNKSSGPVTISAPLIRTLTSEHPTDGGGRSGDQNPIPATRGNLPPRSSIVIVRPTLPVNQDHLLPEPPTILDPNAAPVLTPTEKLGLPWMSKETNSPGPGKNHGIGSKDGYTMGDNGDGPAGYDNLNAQYGPGFIAPGCAYCPYPTYSDEARKVKVQGAVTLKVLVGVDGRAQDIRIVKGIGYGLDERAIETVHGWKFIPARDGSKRAVAAWVTVEADFRLF